MGESRQFQDKIKDVFNVGRVRWRTHAQQRMLERGILRSDIRDIIERGKIIEEYLDDSPYPSFLIFGFARKKPLHALVAYCESEQMIYIVTAYRPDSTHFETDFITRRRWL